MALRRYGKFSGGIDLSDEKQSTLNAPIAPGPPVERLRVPLAACRGAPARCIVKVSQQVSAGQKIAEATGAGGVDVYAPTSGTVSAITTAGVPGDGGFEMSRAVELTELGDPPDIAAPPPAFDWRAADSSTLRERLAGGGLTTNAGPAEPLGRWIERARSKRCGTLVVNAMENQPYVTAAHRLLVEHGAEVIAGLAILASAMEIGEMILAADRRRTEAYRSLAEAARVHPTTRIALQHKYPIGAEAILAKVLTGREVPVGGDATDVGVAVIDAAACLASYQWVVCGKPSTGRVVTVAGERIRRPGNFYVAFGTPCLALTGAADQPVIHGGPMTGLRCTVEAVVAPACDAILAPLVAEPAPAGSCMRCGWCTSHCPARLNVAALNDMFELGQTDRARKAGVLACMECGVCSYVCPARLPLTRRVRQLKRSVILTRRIAPVGK